MAGAILANALVFHEHIAGRHTEIKPVLRVCGPQVGNPQSETLAAWAQILKINYWPIFGVASEILSSLTAAEAKEILNTLQYTVGEFTMLGLENAHNLTGRVFQRLISDRKYLATFYTLPESGAAGAPGGGPAGRGGLERPGGHRQAADWRLCLRHRRPAVGGL